jgi:hypothetical protein
MFTTMSDEQPLGYLSARRVLDLGRSAFFGSDDADLPKAESDEVAVDDRTPQFGYVGSNYAERRILLLGINPGNGLRNGRNDGDAAVMPALYEFCAHPTIANFIRAQRKYEEVCSAWRLWGTECQALLADSGLRSSDVAFTNALPYRTGSVAAFPRAVAENAAKHYVASYITELKPKIIVSLGKRASEILSYAGGAVTAEEVVWNRARAPTAGVLVQRQAALSQLFQLLCMRSA